MTSENIKFSIIIPTHNRAAHILHAVDSVLRQAYTDWELIIVDDGSTDTTRGVIDKIQDRRLNYIYQENKERGAARNTGIRKSTGDYVTFLDSDDQLHPTHLTEAYEMIRLWNQPHWFHLRYEIKTKKGHLIRKINRIASEEDLLKGNPLSCMGVFVRKDIINKNVFNEDRQLAGSEDWELWMRLASQFPLRISNQVTATLISHKNRSVVNQHLERLVARIELARALVIGNETVSNKWPTKKGLIQAHLYAYLSLHLALSGSKSKAIRYLIKAVGNRFSIIFSRKMFGIIKTLLVN